MTYIQIIEKLRVILSIELHKDIVYDSDIAVALGIDYDVLRKQKSRNSPHYYEIMQFLAKRNISINWFFFNQLPESLIESTSNYILLKYRHSVIGSAGAGAHNSEIEYSPMILDKQLLNYINSNYTYTEIVKVFGDSMEPSIPNESLVFIDKNMIDLKSTGVYAINTNEGLFIKRIKIKDDQLYMESDNKEYIDIEIDDFEIVGEVKGVFYKL